MSAASAATVRSTLRRRAPELAAWVLATALFIVAVSRAPGFLAEGTLNGVFLSITLVGLAALGQTLVVIGGGIDLSVPWLITAGALGLTLAAPEGPVATAVVAVALLAGGVIVGAGSGFMVTVLGVPAIIATLAMGGIVQGVLLTAQTQSAAGSLQTPQAMIDLVDARIGPVPIATVGLIILAVVVGLVLKRTRFGRRLLATGRNERVAELAGIDVRRVRIVGYAISGASAVAVGLLAAGFIRQAYASIGSPYLFTSIAAVAIGGVALAGGRGSFWGVLGGASALTLLEAVLPMFDLSQAQLQIVYGLVILLGLAVARFAERAPTRT